jgi:hypothetical protein
VGCTVALYSDLLDGAARDTPSLVAHACVRVRARRALACVCSHARVRCASADVPLRRARGAGLIVDVALEAHRAARLGCEEAPLLSDADAAEAATAPHHFSRAAADAFGATHPAVPTDEFACPSCGRTVQAGRFAAHLEKCLGKGRSAARATAKRGAGGAAPAAGGAAGVAAGAADAFAPAWSPKRNHKKKRAGAAAAAPALPGGVPGAPHAAEAHVTHAALLFAAPALAPVRVPHHAACAQRLAPQLPSSGAATPVVAGAAASAAAAAEDAFTPLPWSARGSRPPPARTADVATWQPGAKPPPAPAALAASRLRPPWLASAGVPLPPGVVAPGLPPPVPLPPRPPPLMGPPAGVSAHALPSFYPAQQHYLPQPQPQLRQPPAAGRNRGGAAAAAGGKSVDGRRRKELRTMLANAACLADLHAAVAAPPVEPFSLAARAIHAAAVGFRDVDAGAAASGVGVSVSGTAFEAACAHEGERDIAAVLANMCSVVSQRNGTLGRLCSNGLGCSNHREPARAALRASLLPRAAPLWVPPPKDETREEARAAARAAAHPKQPKAPKQTQAQQMQQRHLHAPLPGGAFPLASEFAMHTPPPLLLPAMQPHGGGATLLGLNMGLGMPPMPAPRQAPCAPLGGTMLGLGGAGDSDGDEALLLPPGAGGGALMGSHDDALFMLC